jgi:hypothetical protein
MESTFPWGAHTNGEAYLMEDSLNSKDLHKITIIELASREETPEWYGILVAHKEM